MTDEDEGMHPEQKRQAYLPRLPYYDTTVSQELFGKSPKIGVRVPGEGVRPVARFVPRERIKEARQILAEQAAGRLTDREALAAIDALSGRVDKNPIR